MIKSIITLHIIILYILNTHSENQQVMMHLYTCQYFINQQATLTIHIIT